LDSPLYHLALLGDPPEQARAEIEQEIAKAVLAFGLRLGHEVAWTLNETDFRPDERRCSAAIFFCAPHVREGHLQDFLDRGIPILPVVSTLNRVTEEVPTLLRPFNCLGYDITGPVRTATALMECAGLLPRQRRVFVSYRRDEARAAALQLFDELSARLFEVFLDTHGIAPADDFQSMLWHKLCDSDVLLMLDTPNYFESRWTNAEFGRALAKGISVLRVGWPDATPSRRTETVSRVELIEDEIDVASGSLAPEAVQRICLQLEGVRSQSHAVRHKSLVSRVRNHIERIQGEVIGVGRHKAIYIRLPMDKDIIGYPVVGVPTSRTLHDATINAAGKSVAVVYDPVGISRDWLDHLNWLGNQVSEARWVTIDEAGWIFADWDTRV
jgi:hypothetical protein